MNRLIISALCLVASASAMDCPAGWLKPTVAAYADDCYQFSAGYVTYADVPGECEDMGGVWVDGHDQSEMDAVYDLVDKATAWTIAGRTPGQGDPLHFTFPDDGRIVMNGANTLVVKKDGDPDTHVVYSKKVQNVGNQGQGILGEYEKKKPDKMFFALCKLDAPAPVPTCPDGWEELSSGNIGSCYYNTGLMLNYAGAKAECEGMGNDVALPEINSLFEQNALNSLPWTRYWLGMNAIQPSDNDDKTTSNFFLWDSDGTRAYDWDGMMAPRNGLSCWGEAEPLMRHNSRCAFNEVKREELGETEGRGICSQSALFWGDINCERLELVVCEMSLPMP